MSTLNTLPIEGTSSDMYLPNAARVFYSEMLSNCLEVENTIEWEETVINGYTDYIITKE